ncbi:calpain-B [Caerostris extrusa]|uniref:Calpain-B n=1 Tax=Caerostris extrusa TaxID=172846 RepID=A0AAV4NTF0_CAEEX|nr:calpain-B [Caerostris extrusa]
MYQPTGPEIVPFNYKKTYISPHKIFPGRLHFFFEVDDSIYGLPGFQRPLNPHILGEKGFYRPTCRPVCGGETGTGECKLFSQSFGVS